MEILQNATENDNMEWQYIWEIKVPVRIMLLLWKIHSNILPSKALLFSRFWPSIGSSLCQSCMMEVEDVEHIFRKCECSRKIWVSLLSWWGLSSNVFIENVHSMWHSVIWLKESYHKKIWKVLFNNT